MGTIPTRINFFCVNYVHDKLIEQAADFCLANNNVPNVSQSNLLIAALAVSDQKAGKEPTSQKPFYQDIYQISESI
ncbi:hypothetical protein NIES2119_19515 [[Phormidium ambiguum] IAM M-71]|uniref:Uncharacterized protein n=1 Tax=[Phormidium ambiguum] IAM M-71 TaxID=454136 RepID=A0A1U7IFG4_9CYAN|nr:hypothetical protein NIES2119_19515 [Phormidium ambiguum IAM M-71]